MPTRPLHTAAALLFTLATTLAARSARADAVPIDVIARGQHRILIDGVLGDWRHFTELTAVDERAQIQRGASAWTGPDDASFGFAFARDDDALYFAAEVRDDQVVRTREHRGNDDAVLIALAAPGSGGRLVGYDLAIYPGLPGQFAGAVRFRGARSGDVRGAQVVEAPLRSGDGFAVEVRIPWAALPEIRAGITQLRGRVALQDSDSATSPAVDTVLASGPGDGQHPNDLPAATGSSAAAPSTDLVAQFRRAQHLETAEPLFDRPANIAGDAALERVVLFPGYLMASGPGIAGGARYAFVQHPGATPDAILESTVRDVTGDGRGDVVLRVRVPDNAAHVAREVLYVYGAPEGSDQLALLWSHEVGRAQAGHRLTNRATYERGPRIRLALGTNEGFTAANFPRATEAAVPLPLLPWGPNRAELWRWSESARRFELDRADANPDYVGATAAAPADAVPASATAPMREAPDENELLALFRRQRGLSATAQPSFSRHGNVAGSAVPETVAIYGRHLLVLGPGFMNGRSFYSVELPADADSDVLGLELADVTDDGKADAFVRVRRAARAQVRGQQLDVTREYLLVYALEEGHRGRVLGAEIARREGANAIVNAVETPGAPRNAALTIDAGRAVGWTAENYPFHDVPLPGFAPLLLPWTANHRVVYRWNGTALAP